ncbi:phosphonate metabolism protein/1,5-bisphosphokinase (PRPP-forming) PhnN [Paracoccus sp. CPCC 101403]|uniref:Ribose 1,5-bisphosphate phosphokinase PhnN n=2 Tax=Paracoccus broussonetiae TaxID=3075834 RepID=A0ABU3ED42_9RHOB|nr:phosphonate metabolism protein/1,5-bisphosphokinase (PRPP-forming) PhnN [Paracoccus sp. CPCC 101403]MDT1062156.1 phosphonate metabolism protein/1,5-bisphosphokinase (PRPP-forming) PhnN [Paracoccus sp. CPCC 101403]
MTHFAVIGPSGAGKDTLMAAALARRPELGIVRRVITRPSDAGGEDFEGVTPEVFARMLAEGRFLLHWDAHGLRYGLPREGFGEGPRLINLSRRMLAEAQRILPDLQVIHVTARPDVLARRLAARGREDAAEVARRIARETGPLPDGLRVFPVDNSTTIEAALDQFLAALDKVNS